MNSDVIGAIVVLFIGLAILCIGLFILRKDDFINTEKFSVFKNIFFLPPRINYWILKIFVVTGGVFTCLIGFYLIYRDY